MLKNGENYNIEFCEKSVSSCRRKKICYNKINTEYKDREIKSELVTVIGKITDSAELMSQGNSKEVVSMCTALEKLKEQGRQEGRQEGLKDLIMEWTKDGYSVSEIAKLLKKPEEFVKKVQEELTVTV